GLPRRRIYGVRREKRYLPGSSCFSLPHGLAVGRCSCADVRSLSRSPSPCLAVAARDLGQSRRCERYDELLRESSKMADLAGFVYLVRETVHAGGGAYPWNSTPRRGPVRDRCHRASD